MMTWTGVRTSTICLTRVLPPSRTAELLSAAANTATRSPTSRLLAPCSELRGVNYWSWRTQWLPHAQNNLAVGPRRAEEQLLRRTAQLGCTLLK
jgi:hypothetical protein